MNMLWLYLETLVPATLTLVKVTFAHFHENNVFQKLWNIIQQKQTQKSEMIYR